MELSLKRSRKRDKLKNFLGFGRRSNHQSVDSSDGINTTKKDIAPSSRPSTPPASAIQDAMLTTPSPSLPLKGSKPFVKGKSYQKDIALLWGSYKLHQIPEIKELVFLLTAIRDNDKEDKLGGILETCAKSIFDILCTPETQHVKLLQALSALRGLVQKIRTAQISHDVTHLDDSSNMTLHEITTIKTSLLSIEQSDKRRRVSEILDAIIGPATTIFSFVNSASSLIPVPGIQPAVGVVVGMLQTIAQARMNYTDLKEIVTISGEFVTSCAAICFAGAEEPSSELQRAMNKFTKKLEVIAQECYEFSQLNVFSRYLQQSSQANNIRAIKERLIHAIGLFQNESLVNIKLDTEALKRSFDFAALNSLPNHPYYTPIEYLEKSRDDVVKYVSDWIADSSESILWIYGPPGLGKSTVAQQLIYLLQSDDRLAAGVILKHLDNKHPINVIQIIARLIGENHPPAIAHIAEAARKLNSAHGLLGDYLAKYIVDPVEALKYPYQLVIVIDGLDEWPNRDPFLEELIRMSSPGPLKFIMTSRFNHSIERILDRIPTRKYPLPPVSRDVIERYFHHHFQSGDIDWRGRRPDQDSIRRLADMANGLLIWAATVRSLIRNEFDERDPHVILDQILSSDERVVSRNDQLEILYSDVISTLFPVRIQSVLRNFLGAIRIIREDLPIAEFSVITGIPERSVKEIQQRLAALRVRDDPKGDVIFPATHSFHASFVEFIQFGSVETHEPSFKSISTKNAHLNLSSRLLQIVFREFLPSTQGKSYIYSDLLGAKLYAVKFWPLHLSNGTSRTSLPAESILTGISVAALQRWAALFLPHVATRFRDVQPIPDEPTASSLLYDLAMLIGPNDPATMMYHIHCLEVAVRLQPDSIRTWKALGTAYEVSYLQGENKKDLEEQIAVMRKALELSTQKQADQASSGDDLNVDVINAEELTPATRKTNEESGERSGMLNSLALGLNVLFDRQGDLSLLSEAISLHREALLLRPPPHPERSVSLFQLGNTLLTRFQHLGDPGDLDESIQLQREALSLRPAPHHHRFASLTDLAHALQTRFEYMGNPDDVDEAISLCREALALHPAPCVDSVGPLRNLAGGLHARFQQQGSLDDLNESISLMREALKICTEYIPDRSKALASLGAALFTRFERLGASSDLEEAISLTREAVSIVAPSNPDRSGFLNNLAGVMGQRFEMRGDPADLDEAISMMREVHARRPEPHPDHAASANNLANALLTRFEQRASAEDLDEAVLLAKESLMLHPAQHPLRPMSLNGLAMALLIRFEQRGSQNDLDDSIAYSSEALELRAPSHPERWLVLIVHALAIRGRFKLNGNPADLDCVISSTREALDFLEVQSAARAKLLGILANALHSRFKLSGAPDDLDEAVSLNEEALKIFPEAHPDRFVAFCNLARALHTRFEKRGDERDLEKAISLNREALALGPAAHLVRPHVLNSLAKSLRARFKLHGESKDLDDAIALHREALSLRPPSHLRYAQLLLSLASDLYTYFSKDKNLKSLDEAIELYRCLRDFPPSRKRSSALVTELLYQALKARYDLNGDEQDLQEIMNKEKGKRDQEVA